METAGGRAKQTKIWESEALVTHMWCTFDLVVFNVILRSFGARVSKWNLSREGLAVE